MNTRGKDSQAVKVAARVADEATKVAREVAEKAVETASKVAELASKTSESVLLLGKDIEYIKKDVSEIKATMKEQSIQHITRSEFDEHLKTDEDQEKRIRILEENKWKIVAITGILTGFLSVAGSYVISKM